MKKYIGIKFVEAEPCTVDEFNKIRPTFYSGNCQDGYKVVYEDGYISWCPKDIFENSYNELANVDLIDNKEINLMIEIVEDWKMKIDDFADGRLSTKYSRLQDEINKMIEFLKNKK